MFSECLNKNTHDSIQTARAGTGAGQVTNLSQEALRVVEDVLNNLCEDTKTELKKIYSENPDYLRQTFEAIRNTDIYLIRLKSNNEPVGLYGLIPSGAEVQAEPELSDGDVTNLRERELRSNFCRFDRSSEQSARRSVSSRCSSHRLSTPTAVGIYLLTTDNLHNGNVITFLKEARKQVKKWSKEYKLIMDNCYKQNETIKKWLRLLGFKPSKYQDKNFQIYYLGDINAY